ncbi:helix-turn-helix domain-containing protein [Morganella psychrotolerans]|uniref:Transcriptional regulator n=1 Tax=Morganella psychrotolerans TaxID=368603 RepID=A0A1B8HK95_9GAMM|nr:helix-turn-helix transcriptional regulator [Morganella psychrotolerans]OBU09653.1 transcriptional regulator [Morganella psychrotolerans]
MNHHDDYDLVPFSELKAILLKDDAVREALDEIAARKILLSTLKAARKAKKISQTEVAARMATQKQNISRLEKGEYDPQLGTLLRYAEAIGGRLYFDFLPGA